MSPEPTEQHHWLQRLAGRWRVVFAFDHHPVWTEDVRALGDLWIVAEMSGAMSDGSTASMMMTLGYDPDKQRFVGSTVGTIMRNLWIYEGVLDDTGTVLTLECEGPDMDGSGRIAHYQDVITIEDENSRSFSSRLLDEQSQWKPVMSASYTRITDG